MNVYTIDQARAWREEFRTQADQLQHSAGQLVDQLRIEGQSQQAASVIEAANVAMAALGTLSRLGMRVTGVPRALG